MTSIDKLPVTSVVSKGSRIAKITWSMMGEVGRNNMCFCCEGVLQPENEVSLPPCLLFGDIEEYLFGL